MQVEESSYSFPQAAAQTGLDRTAIPSAIDLGILSTVTRGGRVRISARSVEQFNVEYVAISVLAKRLRSLSRVLVRMCVGAQIPLVTLRRTLSPAPQSILSRDSEARLLALWEAEHAPRVRRGADNTHIYESALRAYLEKIQRSGGQLPRRGSKPNHAVIAKSCGFSRNVLATFPSVVAMLSDFEASERARVGRHTASPIEALRAYLGRLRETNALLPRAKRGRPNRRVVAQYCGFDRSVFYRYPEVEALLEEYAANESDCGGEARAAMAV